MKKALKFILPVLAILVYIACKKPFNSPVVSTNYNYLVVEGNINSGDSTIFKLSRTQAVGNKDQFKAELKAIVTIKSNQNISYTLVETGSGNYKMGPVTLDKTQTYSLFIKTSNGETYQSDFVPFKITPPIDSIYYQVADTALQFYVNTHDPQNNTHYYRWDYQETWSYVANERSYYKVKNGVISPFNPDSIFTCYKFAPSKSVYVANTSQLSQDVVAKQPLGVTGPGSQKISHIYSFLLSQYALTGDGIAYFTELKKNSEQLGSIFDAQPTTTLGNIRCINNPAEPVIGFINASTISKKRIIVNVNAFGLSSFRLGIAHYFGPPFDSDCVLDTLSTLPKISFPTRSTQLFFNGFYIPVNVVIIYPPGASQPDTIGLSYAQRTCVDCRLMGGTNVKPSFFP
jgi:hypothetical protein